MIPWSTGLLTGNHWSDLKTTHAYKWYLFQDTHLYLINISKNSNVYDKQR